MTSLEPIALIGHDAVLNGGNLKSNLVPYQLILKLAADATLTKSPTSLKWVDFQWVRWRKRFLAAIKQLWSITTITPSEFIWLEPDIYTYKIIDELYTKATKKSGISFNRCNKKMYYKRSSKECIAKK